MAERAERIQRELIAKISKAVGEVLSYETNKGPFFNTEIEAGGDMAQIQARYPGDETLGVEVLIKVIDRGE